MLLPALSAQPVAETDVPRLLSAGIPAHRCPCPVPRRQDLREECIKLKKRVFDLERQNQLLSGLLQQRLQLPTGSLPQVGRAFLCTPGRPGPALPCPLSSCHRFSLLPRVELQALLFQAPW